MCKKGMSMNVSLASFTLAILIQDHWWKTLICTTLTACCLSLNNCISQCYDSASVMSGKLYGSLAELAPCGIYILTTV